MAEPLSSITGLASGIDSKSLVEQIIRLEHRSADRLQATVDANAKRTKALGELQTALAAVKDAAASLVDGTAFDAFSTTTSGTAAGGRALLSATAGPTATPGAYKVRVLALATAHKLTASAGQASATTPLGVTGTFELRRLDDTVLGSVTLDGSESLATIRDRINGFTGTSKVQASVFSVAANGTDQRLALASQQTGAAGTFKLVATAGDPLTPLGLAAPIVQSGTDARVDIDGVVVTRPTNTVTDVLKGVTLTLSAEDPTATATVTVERYPSSPRDVLKGFVDAYNKAHALLKTQTAPGGPLAGEPLARSARGMLSGAVIATGAGLPADFSTLARAGVSLGKDGTLSFDAVKFDAAYTDRYTDLRASLANRLTAVADVVGSLSTPVTGSIDRREVALNDNTARLTTRIADIDARLEKKRARLLAQYAKFEASLGSINSLGSSLSAQLKGLNARSNN